MNRTQATTRHPNSYSMHSNAPMPRKMSEPAALINYKHPTLPTSPNVSMHQKTAPNMSHEEGKVRKSDTAMNSNTE